jgi:hypothetical protein
MTAFSSDHTAGVTGVSCVMSRGPNSFRQRDLTRAIRGAQAAGVEVARVEIEKDERIILVLGKPTEAIQDDETPEDLKKLI